MVNFNNPDIVIWNSTEQTKNLIDITEPQYYNVGNATTNKITKHKDPHIETQKFWIMKKLQLRQLWLVHLGLHVTALHHTWKLVLMMGLQE